MKTAFILLLLLLAFGVVGRIDYDCARIAEAYRVDARLRYRAKEGKVTFWYELIRSDKVLEAAAAKIVTTVSEGTRAPLFFGNPFAA